MRIKPLGGEEFEVDEREVELLEDLLSQIGKTSSPVVKAGLPPNFGDAKKRRAQLVSRLKVRRRYKDPVKGGRKKKKKRKTLGGSFLRGRKATSLGGKS